MSELMFWSKKPLNYFAKIFNRRLLQSLFNDARGFFFMTAADRNRILGALFIVFGSINILLLIPATVQGLRVIGRAQRAARETGSVEAQQVENQLSLLFIVAVVVGSFILVAAILEILAGYGMLKQKPWAHSAALVAAVTAIVSLISFPVGVVLGIYTLWFLASQPGKAFYGQLLNAAAAQPSK